ncbi:MAG: epoxyqueuosine reductase QueH [Clostridia bacterium]|nr:epoxyqueuosine reductase QueH [Clostridia bacterium]
MSKVFYENFLREKEAASKLSVKPKLLLHACCAPCSTACLEALTDVFDVTVYYYNPNISPKAEYEKRVEEIKRFCSLKNIKVIEERYVPNEFDDAVKGLENEKEGGARCFKCYALRLDETARFAKENGYEYFCSTLSVSPYKNAEKLNEIGEELSKKYGVKHLPNDFKKGDGYLRSIRLSEEYGLYRQNFCGCVYSKKNGEDAK